jgi:hypothetical protein
LVMLLSLSAFSNIDRILQVAWIWLVLTMGKRSYIAENC